MRCLTCSEIVLQWFIFFKAAKRGFCLLYSLFGADWWGWGPAAHKMFNELAKFKSCISCESENACAVYMLCLSTSCSTAKMRERPFGACRNRVSLTAPSCRRASARTLFHEPHVALPTTYVAFEEVLPVAAFLPIFHGRGCARWQTSTLQTADKKG